MTKIEKAFTVINRLKEAGYEAVIAGGAVRDMLLNLEPADVDIATDARPDAIEALFEHTVAIGKSFGVIIVVIDDEPFEVATFRRKHTTEEGTPIFGTMEEDAKARDLTINAMFATEDYIGNLKIIDFVGGKEDLKNGIIRLNGYSMGRLREDFIRMLRVIRFAIKYDFSIASKTLAAVTYYAEKIRVVSPERVFSELLKILRLNKHRKALELFYSTGLMKYTIPFIASLKGLKQPEKWHPEGDVFEHTIRVLENLPDDASDELRVAALYHDVGKISTKIEDGEITFKGHEKDSVTMVTVDLSYFRVSNAMCERIQALIRDHMKILFCKDLRKSKLKKLLREPHFQELMILGRADAMGARGDLGFYEFLESKLADPEFNTPEKLRPKPLLTGRDLIALGFTPSKLFSEILLDVEDKQLDGCITSKEDAKVFVIEHYLPF